MSSMIISDVVYGNTESVGTSMNADGTSGNSRCTGGTDSDTDSPVSASGKTRPGRECQTCKNRKYQDGSNEMVSFKTAQHISPSASSSRVMAHEMEHVSNAYNEAQMKDGKVLQCSVSLKTAVCPECGRVYISGGETRSTIQYSNDDSYNDSLKDGAASFGKGNRFDTDC